MELIKLADKIEIVDNTLKSSTNKAVNQLLTIRNWLIGFYIVEYEQHGEDRATYGEKIIKNLALKLKEKDFAGLSFTNLNLFRQFFLSFPEIIQTVSEQFIPELIPSNKSLSNEKSDSDPIGNLLVTGKNQALVEYATAGMDKNLFVSNYLFYISSKEKLEKSIISELKEL
ncbi:MAG: DUF1016 family protein [Candidatus Delongbacteria bacterium]|nr:DUF1016 family protein [Candidatus Delongbacteria bacterium]MBN2835645.1 DUF1016 family protein [Candidatus Delongbacteria bacterium]